MIRKMIPALGLAIVLLTASGPCLMANSQSTFQTDFQEDIPNEVVVAVCLQLEKNRMASADTILGWYRSGDMTITKVDSGVYAAVLPGGLETLVLIDAL